MWQAIADARVFFTVLNHGVVMHRVGPLPVFDNPTADPPYMSGNQGSNKAKTESAAQRQRIIARAAAVPVAAAGPVPPPAVVPAVAAPMAPAGPLPAPLGPPQPVAVPGGPRLPATGAPAGAAVGALAAAVCHQPQPAGWAPALLGPPTSVCIHIIMPEAHGQDPLHGGWILILATISPTVVVGMHSLIALTAVAASSVPAGHHVRYINALN